MITLAPGTGRAGTGCSSADCDPIHLTGVVTLESHPSSSEESLDFEDEYQEPAWLASRTDIVSKWSNFSINLVEMKRVHWEDLAIPHPSDTSADHTKRR